MFPICVHLKVPELRSTDLALRAIISATQIGALPEHAPESYLKLLRRQKPA
jgi:hypothetical protein